MARFPFFNRNSELTQLRAEVDALKAEAAKYPTWALAMAEGHEAWRDSAPLASGLPRAFREHCFHGLLF